MNRLRLFTWAVYSTYKHADNTRCITLTHPSQIYANLSAFLKVLNSAFHSRTRSRGRYRCSCSYIRSGLYTGFVRSIGMQLGSHSARRATLETYIGSLPRLPGISAAPRETLDGASILRDLRRDCGHQPPTSAIPMSPEHPPTSRCRDPPRRPARRRQQPLPLSRIWRSGGGSPPHCWRSSFRPSFRCAM